MRPGLRSVALGAGLVLGLLVAALGVVDARSGSGTALPGCTPPRSQPVVAVVDSGIAPLPALAGRITARRTVAGTGAGDHGTEMAVIVARTAPGAQLLDVRVLDDRGRGSAAALAAGIDQALAAGASVMSLSVALPDAPEVDAALRRASAAGIAMVVAAGNDGADLDRIDRWRALAELPCVVVVGALGVDGRPFARSNRGDEVIEAWEQGEDVAALDGRGAVVAVDGTSPAAAAVAGHIARGDARLD